MAADEKSESTSNGSGASGGGSKLITILTIVNVVATLSVAAVLFVSFQKDKKHPSVEDIAAHPSAESSEGGEKPKAGKDGKAADKKAVSNFGKMVTLEQFTVNLSTPGSVNPKFARVNISLEVPNEDTESEVTQKMPQVRNAVIDLFNSKRPTDLATSEGRDYLKEEIRNALNSFMVTGKVKGVFFTNFALTG